MKFTPSLLVLALLAGFAPAQDARPEMGNPTTTEITTQAGEVTPDVDPLRSWTPEQRQTRAEELINKPLSVHGVTITPGRVRQALVLRHGRLQLDSRRLDLMIDAELEARRARGEDVASVEPNAEEIDVAVQAVIDGVRAQYPNLSVDDVLASNNLSSESLRRQMVQTKRFDKVFLPSDRDWPAVTTEALSATMEPAMIAQIKETMSASQDAAGGAQMWSQMVRQMIVQNLLKNSVVETPVDGLPDAVAQRVNGRDTLVAEVWDEVKPLVHPEDVRRIRQFLARMEAARQDLFAKGAWLTDDEFQAVYDKEAAVGAGGPFNIDMVVLTMKRFPDMNSYKAVLRGQRSYEKMIQDQITEEELTNWVGRAGRLLGLGEVTTEIIHIAAYDHTVGAWHDNGWAAAQERADQMVEQLVESEGADWDRLLEENSDFYDPPVPAAAQQQPGQQLKNKGRFGSIHRNLLMQMLGESEYTVFVDGYSIADEVYYHQNVGSIDGPFKGKYGYYITRVDGRSGAKKPITLADENMRSMVLEDYVMQHFVVYAQQMLEQAEVVGL